jgi:DNA-directed RNA polymerase specialized sigma24 family protein
LPARQLTPLQQEILVLSYLGGYTVRQVSALLSLPTASVKDALTGALLGLAAPRPALLP